MARRKKTGNYSIAERRLIMHAATSQGGYSAMAFTGPEFLATQFRNQQSNTGHLLNVDLNLCVKINQIMSCCWKTYIHLLSRTEH